MLDPIRPIGPPIDSSILVSPRPKQSSSSFASIPETEVRILTGVEDPIPSPSKIRSAISVSSRRSPIETLPNMPFRGMMEVEPPSPIRYLIGAAIMMAGVVLPVGYMMFRNKRAPSSSSSSSSYSKQTSKVLI
ncbi:uncharacterized protein LOC115686464 [Syzygium oleosum]|uniref:uncharacterized protein LOC115686464 n=1 Tax=Syzygium oleosum TaxID=219896 RepID=UPI0011D1CB1B|nr:uncharacterized protein LOC115686464 [Syzygium oleosum]